MSETPYDVCVEIRRGKDLIDSAAVSTAACVEDSLFRGVLDGSIDNDGTTLDFEFVPSWGDDGAPALAGFALRGTGDTVRNYDVGVFAAQARMRVQALVASKQLAADDRVTYSYVATPRQAQKQSRFAARIRRAAIPLREAELPHVPTGTFAIEFDPSLLRVIRERVTRAGAEECAGLLFGALLRDRERRAALLCVSAQTDVEAGEGGASQVHFAFGPQSLTRAQQAGSELGYGAPVGWLHSHPGCAACQVNPLCRADLVFWSLDDQRVHEAAFPAAWTIGLVAGKVRDLPATEPGFRVYGWDAACIIERPLQRRTRTAA